MIQAHDEPRLNPKTAWIHYRWVQTGTRLRIQAERERLFHEERKWRSIKAGHQNEMKLYYLSIIDNNILINAARTNATINHMTFITGAGMLLIIESVFFILILLSKPVVYKGNINTVT